MRKNIGLKKKNDVYSFHVIVNNVVKRNKLIMNVSLQVNMSIFQFFQIVFLF